MGWLKDYPDIRDYTLKTREIRRLIKLDPDSNDKLPEKVDLREWCSPIEDQGNLGSCTANAVCGLVEYLENRAFGKYIDASRLFLYKVTRRLLGFKGDTGAYIRSTMGALALFGVPPEKYWPYDIEKFDVEPPAFCYAFAQNYQGLKYYRIDDGSPRRTVLKVIKQHLAMGYPLAFGFTVYSSIRKAEKDGKIPFPSPWDSVWGGHAVMAVGYDDSLEIPYGKNQKTVGAFLIRNSWGEEWGDKGYGYLPYDYVLYGLAVDWWALIKQEWVDTKQFGF